MVAAASDPFEALGDPTRRRILELLGREPQSVAVLADQLPVSRPAVSRHLRLLKEAGFVEEVPEGTRRVYHVRDDGLEAIRAYLEQVWGEAAARLRLVAENTEPREPTVIEPLLVEVELECPADHAFATWTERFGVWWPPGHRTSGDPEATVHLEPRLGGRIFERTSDGREIDWGEVTEWDPPRRLGYLWHIRRGREQATDVRIHFVDDRPGTSVVRIEHTGWERLGAEGQAWRDANRGGWAGLLPHFKVAAENEEG